MVFVMNLCARRMGGVQLVSLLLLLLLQLDYGVCYGATCESNLECCKHRPWTAAFRECCRDGCCPDCNQVNYVPAIKKLALKEGCEASHECCVYPAFSERWLYCCSKHPCCTLCHMVSKGCCYSGEMYPWGAMVNRLEDEGISLLCGAKIYKTEPHLVASIVPRLALPDTDHCEECTESGYCVGSEGIVRVSGSEWFESPCSLCHCNNENVQCSSVRPKCPDPPYPECVPLPSRSGTCCNEWDCSSLESMCIDVYGEVRQEGEQWTGRDDPCLLYMCKAGGMILSARRYCPSPSRVNVPSGCELQTRPNECCPVIHCPECEDVNGTTYSAGDSWDDPKDTCYTFHCLSGGSIQRRRKTCPKLYRPFKSDCVLQHENCCPTWICGGCVDKQGMAHAEGTTWVDKQDPCVTYFCSDQGILLVPKQECAPHGPQPGPECRHVKKNCCDDWQCPGDKTYCLDDQGARREVGDSWIDPVNPCIHWLCPEDLVPVKAIVDCAMPPSPPSVNCIIEMDQCCPVWSCPCVDAEGAERVVGDVWEHPTNKCLSVECTSKGAQEKVTPCPQVSHTSPGRNCVMQFDGCCLAWNCPTEPPLTGECPNPFSFNRNCFQYFDQCYYDSECGYNRRCCLVAGCGRECMSVAKPGKCPVIRFLVAPQCTPEMQDGCQWDHECPGRQKCCFLHCARHCVIPQ